MRIWSEKAWLRWTTLVLIHLTTLLVPSIIVWTGHIYWDQDDMVLLYAGLQGLVLYYSSRLLRAKFLISYLFNVAILLILSIATGSILLLFGHDQLRTYFSGCDTPNNSFWYMVETQMTYFPISGLIGSILATVRWAEGFARFARKRIQPNLIKSSSSY